MTDAPVPRPPKLEHEPAYWIGCCAGASITLALNGRDKWEFGIAVVLFIVAVVINIKRRGNRV